MIRLIYIINIVIVLLFAQTAIADQRISGYITPLPEELLERPIVLDCGATIREVRGTIDYSKINSMCTHALSNFFKFIEAKGLKAERKNSFRWNLSFLPEYNCYRCLNDEVYRFKNRYVHGRLIGYTDMSVQYAFMSNVRDDQFNITVVHELFHSMSMYYGVYMSHPGSWSEKTMADENLAKSFTLWLGYGM